MEGWGKAAARAGAGVPGAGEEDAMLLKSCARCGKLIPYGPRYCEECKKIVDEQTAARAAESSKRSDRAYNQRRDPRYGQFYRSKEWRIMARKRIQDDNYRCRICGQVATEVDHIVPIQTAEGWERRLDYDNTQSVCVKCHNEKHHRFQSGTKKRRTNDMAKL